MKRENINFYQHSKGRRVTDSADGVAKKISVERHRPAGADLAHPVDLLGAGAVSFRVELSHDDLHE